MKTLLTKDNVRILLEGSESPCISIFLPTHVRGREIRQDAIRLKNLLGIAEEQLRALGVDRASAGALLKEPRALLKQALFWRHQSEGLALFRSPAHFRYFCLPFAFEELAVVAERFHIKPLLLLLEEEGRFYVLALHKQGCTLFQGSASGMREVDLWVEAPSAGGNAGLQQPTTRVQLSSPAGPGRARGRLFTGHGEDPVQSKNRSLDYFREVNGRLNRILTGERAPLILAGTDPLLALFAEVNSYPHLAEDRMVGNPDPLSLDALHAGSLDLARKHFRKARKTAVERHAKLAGTGRTSERLEEIVPAAVRGRVDILFVGVGLHRWGTADPKTGECTIHQLQKEGDRDLINFAAVETLERSGIVYAVEPGQMPVSGPAAAIFRY